MKITEKALNQIEKLNSDNKCLRISVVGGGCSGLSYKMEFTKEINDKDEFFDYHEAPVVIDKKSYLFLKDVTLDFEDGLNGKGFTFTNPAAKRSCGCGESFSV